MEVQRPQASEELKQSCRIEIRKNEQVIFVYESMRSGLVRSRSDQIKRFYESVDAGVDLVQARNGVKPNIFAGAKT